MDLRKNDLGKIEQAYKDGLAIREKLTDSTPKFIIIVSIYFLSSSILSAR